MTDGFTINNYDKFKHYINLYTKYNPSFEILFLSGKYQTNVKGEPYAKNPVPVGAATPATPVPLDDPQVAGGDQRQAPATPAIDPTDSWVDTSKAAAAPEKEPTVGNMPLPDKTPPPPPAPAKKADNVSLPRTQGKQPSKTATVAPKIGSMVGAGYDGTTRLKYLAGIKE